MVWFIYQKRMTNGLICSHCMWVQFIYKVICLKIYTLQVEHKHILNFCSLTVSTALKYGRTSAHGSIRRLLPYLKIAWDGYRILLQIQIFSSLLSCLSSCRVLGLGREKLSFAHKLMQTNSSHHSGC